MNRSILCLSAVLALVLVIAVSLTSTAGANNGLIKTHFPSEEDPGAPVYARIEPVPPHVYSDGENVAIVFYRDPDCIPADFNLLTLFDFNNAFGCTLLVQGTHFWEGEPFVVIPPFMATLSGSGAVPVWFLPEDVINQAIQDDVLTIGELAGLEGLRVGYAEQFNEMIQPEPIPGEAGGNPNPKLNLNAHGWLEDGGQFNLHITGIGYGINNKSIQIQLPEG